MRVMSRFYGKWGQKKPQKTNLYLKSERFDISGTHHEERVLGEFDTQGTY